MTTILLTPITTFTPAEDRWVWFVGCHGGAGETTLADLLPASGDAHHRWPIGQPVVLVARTHAAGLLAAQKVLTWAAGDPHLLGIVLSADVPGKLPRDLTRLAFWVLGAAPRSWYLPWIPAWRTGDRADPKVTVNLFAQIAAVTAPEESP